MDLAGLSDNIVRARDTIAGIAIETPLLSSHLLGKSVDADIALKLENLQVTGSFKVRGAANKILALSDEERARGLVACSSGNHGRAVAYVSEQLGVSATICVPEWVDRTKLEAMQRHGAETILHGSTYDEAEERSLQIQKERELSYVSPFDDPDIIAGQGTIGLELREQWPGLDAVVVPVSGGGLIAGIGLALKMSDPTVRVVGVSAENARTMVESLAAGRPITFPEEKTIANALAGGIGFENHHTFDLVRELVDEHVLVTEEELRRAMSFSATELNIVVEGGGAAGIAALLSGKYAPAGAHVAVVVSGGNVDPQILTQVISEGS